MDKKLLKTLKAHQSTPPEAAMPSNALENVRNMVRSMRDLKHEVKELEERQEEKKKLLTQIETKDLPDLFAEYNLSSLGLDAEGNMPSYVATAQPYYKAVLPKESDAGLRWLEENGHGDMIKRVYTIKLDRGTEEIATQLREFLEEHDLAFEEKEDVPWATLTAFVKEQIEKYSNTPPLELLGAFVGKIVKLKPKKEK